MAPKVSKGEKYVTKLISAEEKLGKANTAATEAAGRLKSAMKEKLGIRRELRVNSGEGKRADAKRRLKTVKKEIASAVKEKNTARRRLFWRTKNLNRIVSKLLKLKWIKVYTLEQIAAVSRVAKYNAYWGVMIKIGSANPVLAAEIEKCARESDLALERDVRRMKKEKKKKMKENLGGKF